MPMKITQQKLKEIIKEELNELGRTYPQMVIGEPSGSGSRQIAGTPKAYILDAFQDLYEAWQPQTPEGEQYKEELGVLIEKMEGASFLDDKGKF